MKELLRSIVELQRNNMVVGDQAAVVRSGQTWTVCVRHQNKWHVHHETTAQLPAIARFVGLEFGNMVASRSETQVLIPTIIYTHDPIDEALIAGLCGEPSIVDALKDVLARGG